jgi:alkylation response protein AidB-like acyl-CoA dehydrogenase
VSESVTSATGGQPAVPSPFAPPPDEAHWIETAERLAAGFASTAAALDASGELPGENLRLLFEHGFDTAMLPRDAGGGGLSFRTFGRVLGTIARGCSSTACIWLMHVGAAVGLVQMSEPAAARYYAAELRAGKRFANALSEPSSGNMFLIPMQHAAAAPGGWRLDGAKRFVSGCEIADHLLVNALVDGVPTFFGVEPDATVAVEEIWDAMGMRATRSQLVTFNGTLLRADRRCRPLDSVTEQNPIPVGLGWLSIGVADAALAALCAHATRRVIPSTGQPLSGMQWVQFAVADARVRLEAARLLTERLMWLADTVGGPIVLFEAMQAKLLANQVAQEVAQLALSVGGGTGYLKSSPIERHFRDAQAGALMAYSVEVCRDFVGKHTLGLGAAP